MEPIFGSSSYLSWKTVFSGVPGSGLKISEFAACRASSEGSWVKAVPFLGHFYLSPWLDSGTWRDFAGTLRQLCQVRWVIYSDLLTVLLERCDYIRSTALKCCIYIYTDRLYGFLELSGSRKKGGGWFLSTARAYEVRTWASSLALRGSFGLKSIV